MDSFWSDYSQFEASQVVSSSLSMAEKAAAIQSALVEVSQQYQAASEEWAIQREVRRRSKKRGEFWNDIKLDDLAMRVISDEDKKQIALWKKLLT